MLEAENQDELLVQQNNSCPVGTKRVPESNYGSAPKKGKFMHKGNGSGKKTRHRGPPMGRGANKWQRDAPRENLPGPPPNPPANARRAQPQMVGPARPAAQAPTLPEGACSRCGYTGHFYRQCKATKEVVKAYKAYKDLGHMQVHNVEVDNVEEAPNANLSIDDFDSPKTKDAPEFMDEA